MGDCVYLRARAGKRLLLCAVCITLCAKTAGSSGLAHLCVYVLVCVCVCVGVCVRFILCACVCVCSRVHVRCCFSSHFGSRWQKMLGWLTGDRKSYSPEDFRTRVYRQGHFDKRVAHAQAGRRYVFGPGSFSGFRRDAHTDYFLKGLMLAGNVKSFGGGTLSGLDSKGSNLIAHRVSTDERFQPAMEAGDVDYFERLHAWAKTANKSHLTTREVLGIYARNEELAGHILLLEFDKRRKNVQVDRKSEDSVRLLNNPAA
eukprot:jgi/Mesen1/4790/ME000243S03971